MGFDVGFGAGVIHQAEDTFDLHDYPGMHRRALRLTAAMAIFMLSLIGIPPLVGFLGKLYVFGAVVAKGSAYYWYAAVGAVNAAIAAFYYARVMKTMIIDQGGEDKPPLVLAVMDKAWVILLVAGNVLPLVWWSAIDGWARNSLTLYAGL